MSDTFVERHPFLAVLVGLVGAAVPGFALYFLTGGATWGAILAGMLAVPFGVLAALIVELLAA